MRFSSDSPIFAQIADLLVEEILAGRLAEGSRLPSARELAASLEVNANTAARALMSLADAGVARIERGSGHFVAEGGRDLALAGRRRRFYDETLPALFRSMAELGVEAAELSTRYAHWKAGGPSSPAAKERP